METVIATVLTVITTAIIISRTGAATHAVYCWSWLVGLQHAHGVSIAHPTFGPRLSFNRLENLPTGLFLLKAATMFERSLSPKASVSPKSFEAGPGSQQA